MQCHHRIFGGEHFNPDEVTRSYLAASKWKTQQDANSQAWDEGRRRLEDAIREKAEFVFETTLGGTTITELLVKALDEGLDVAILSLGLEKFELHIDWAKPVLAVLLRRTAQAE